MRLMRLLATLLVTSLAASCGNGGGAAAVESEGPPRLRVQPTRIDLVAPHAGPDPKSFVVRIEHEGPGPIAWQAATDTPWLRIATSA